MSDFSKMTGKLPFDLFNDYFFRLLLQKNNDVLKDMIAAFLEINTGDISSAKLQAEYFIEKSFKEKESLLGISIVLKNGKKFDVQMQIIDLPNWADRSISYLLHSESTPLYEDSITVKPTIQIAILKNYLFPTEHEFYSTYYLMNNRSHQKYNESLRLSVLNIHRTDLATYEDKVNGVYEWGAFFAAQTWEDLKNLSYTYAIISSAVSTLYEIVEDSLLLKQIWAREYQIELENRLLEASKSAKEINNELKSDIMELRKKIFEHQKQIAAL